MQLQRPLVQLHCRLLAKVGVEAAPPVWKMAMSLAEPPEAVVTIAAPPVTGMRNAAAPPVGMYGTPAVCAPVQLGKASSQKVAAFVLQRQPFEG